MWDTQWLLPVWVTGRISGFLAIINITNFSHYEISHASPNDCLSNPGSMGIIASLAPNRPNTNTPILPPPPSFHFPPASTMTHEPTNYKQSIQSFGDKYRKTLRRLGSLLQKQIQLSMETSSGVNTAPALYRSLQNIRRAQLQYNNVNVFTLMEGSAVTNAVSQVDDWKTQSILVDKKNQLDVTFCILYFSSNSCSNMFRATMCPSGADDCVML